MRAWGRGALRRPAFAAGTGGLRAAARKVLRWPGLVAVLTLAMVGVFSCVALRPSANWHGAGANGSTVAGGSASPSSSSNPVADQFARFSRWSDPATWGGRVPTAGQVVTIPAGRQVLVDIDLPTLGGLVVLGDLAFADRPTVVRVGSIMVHGNFWMGTDARPLTSNITLILGAATVGGQSMGDVSMGVNSFTAMGGGRIQIHGRDEGITWTRLGTTAGAGSTTLSLSDPVSWQVGDQLVVASSDVEVDHKERVRISARSADGRSVTVTPALRYSHVSTSTSVTSGGASRTVEERAEVGLLSHNIKITGPDDAPKTKVGGHIMIMAGGVLRMSNAELYAMGQIGALGRYPIHWHFVGDGSQSLVKDVSLHDCFNRFVTIHQTDNVSVDGVVADETYGHGFFLEDGVEQHNKLTDNLVMGVRYVPDNKAIRKSDAIPAEFWISNPSNDLIGNSAAGGQGVGIWYDFNSASDNSNIEKAINLAFGRNENNTAHSHKFTHDHPFPNEDEGSGISIDGYEGPYNHRGTVLNPNVWKNDGFGLWLDGAITTVNPTAANNSEALTCQTTAVKGGLLIGAPTANTTDVGAAGGLLRFYHGQCDVDSTWLAGFASKPGTSPELVAITDNSASTWDATNRVRGLKFFGNGQRVLFGNNRPYYDPAQVDHSHWLADLDGSVRGDGVPVMITDHAPMISDPREKPMYPGGGSGYYAGSDFGFVSPLDHGIMRVRFGESWNWQRDDGVAGQGINSGVVLGHQYALTPPDGRSVDSLSFDIQGSDPGHVTLVFPWNGSATPKATIAVAGKRTTTSAASSASGLADGQFYVDTAAHKLYVRVGIGGTAEPFGHGGEVDSLVNGYQYWSVA